MEPANYKCFMPNTSSVLQVKLLKSFKRGLKFLESKQRCNGSFVDFESSGVPSNQWITAHLCWVLGDMIEFSEITKRGANYLRQVMKLEGCWGYNANVAGDISTTAQAIMALSKQGISDQVLSLEWVSKHQGKDGSFGTYPKIPQMQYNNWSASHDDTTLEVICMFQTLQIYNNCSDLTIKWASEKYLKRGLSSFWWKGDSYILWLQKRLALFYADAESTSTSNLHMASTSCELSLLLEGLSAKYPIVEDSLSKLMDMQLNDGSWNCSPCLRIPKLKILDSHTDLSREICYPGENRIFSTIHAVACISSYFVRD